MIMKEPFAVKEVKTGVILVKGSYEYCKKWIFNNCKYIKKYDCWTDADHEEVTLMAI